ncbi:hypothetical protein MT349_19685 [Rathayibacter caricis]|uniref:hypothetical protein n=1 Tax=Rathayibacter caricis TaxID=110936 RepID=UPI001FB2F58E|nr:hypothetical protein [Rathayibacter caricis]MCJ1698011.1 hypothetical protein [Rathayibacter caricis]
MVDPTNVAWTVERQARDSFSDMALRANVSAAVFFERLVKHVESELTDEGIPSWWPSQPTLPNEELPITPD